MSKGYFIVNDGDNKIERKQRAIMLRSVVGRLGNLVDASLRRHYPDQVLRVFLSHMGGPCLLIGTTPSKAPLASTNLVVSIRINNARNRPDRANGLEKRRPGVRIGPLHTYKYIESSCQSQKKRLHSRFDSSSLYASTAATGPRKSAPRSQPHLASTPVSMVGWMNPAGVSGCIGQVKNSLVMF